MKAGTGPDGKPITYFDPYDFYLHSMGLPARHPGPEAYFPVERTRENNSFQRYNALARWQNDHFNVKYAFTQMIRYQPVIVGDDYSDLPAYTYPLPAVLPNAGNGVFNGSINNPRKR